jgi:RND family efflux transporter MFP subunit
MHPNHHPHEDQQSSPGWPLKPVAWALAVALLGSWLWTRGNEGAALGTNTAQAADEKAAKDTKEAKPKAALTVSVTQPQPAEWPRSIPANGSIAAWQEAIVGTEAGGLRLMEVRVNVGDVVRRGQLLAQLQSDTVAADVAATKASLAEAEAQRVEAHANAERAALLKTSGALSAQQIQQYQTAEQTAKARADALKAKLTADQLRLGQTRIVAPDDGVISARVATVGAVVQPGQELFRLIRQQRLEWRAEVPAADLGKLKPGMAASGTTAGGGSVRGKLRMVAPTVDAGTRNGLVYVDLPHSELVKAGMFATGQFEVGQTQALTLPQSAVLQRDGFSYVFIVGSDAKVLQSKVAVGRRLKDRVEVQGLAAGAKVVASGVGFLSDGDTVRVVDAAQVNAAVNASAGNAGSKTP